MNAKPANPLMTRQAPDNKALYRNTVLILEKLEGSTPPMAQEYFEPGINTSLRRRKTPKANYTLPQDLPKFPIDFVPTNQTPGAEGEEPPIVKVKESVPADLMDVFAKISVQQALEQQATEEAKRLGRMDVGTMLSKQLTTTRKDFIDEAKLQTLIEKGYKEEEALSAMEVVRMEGAIKEARKAVQPQPIETVLKEVFPKREMEVQTEVGSGGGREMIAYTRAPRRTREEIAMFKAIEAMEKEKEEKGGSKDIRSFFPKKE